MDLIKRPKQVQRAEKGYLDEKKYQDYAESQFKTIYDKTDEIIKNMDTGGSGGLLTNSVIGWLGGEIPEGFEEIEISGGGGSGEGTNNYEDLTNKPKIEGKTLIGNKTLSDLNIKALTNTELEELINSQV